MNERWLKGIIYVAGAVCLYAFVAVRVPGMFNAVLKEKIIPEYWENTRYGELYYFSHIKNFREEGLPHHAEKYRFSERHPSLEEADIVLIGDSFFDFTRMTTFPERLGDTLGLRAYYAREADVPLDHLAQQAYEKGSEKILIFESAERYIPERFSRTHELGRLPSPSSFPRSLLRKTRQTIFQDNTDVLYQTLLNRNYLTTGLFSMSATMKFNTLGYITDQTPKYSLDQDVPWLFYHDQLNGEPSSFYYQHSDEEIARYCDNIADLSRKMYEAYGFHMVFMAIPSKYTLYHGLINEDAYNNFLPRLYTGLEERNIPYIRLYEDFKDANEVLYYGTDTHWKKNGLNLALEKTVEMI